MKLLPQNYIDELINEQILISSNFNKEHPSWIRNYFLNSYKKEWLYGQNPFATIMINEKAKELLKGVAFKKHKINDQSYYVIPNFFYFFDYADTEKQKKVLVAWIELSDKLLALYKTCSNTREFEFKHKHAAEEIEEQLIEKAKELLNTITFESSNYKQLNDISNYSFWNSYFYSYRIRKLAGKNSEKISEKKLVDCFENYDDIINFENLQKEYGISTDSLQYKIWKKALTKLCQPNAIKELTPVFKHHYDQLMSKHRLKSDEVLKLLKVLEYCEYSVVKDVYHFYNKNPTTTAISNHTKELIEKYEPSIEKKINLDFTDFSYRSQFFSELSVSMPTIKNYLDNRFFINDKRILTKLLDVLVCAFVKNEKDTIKFIYNITNKGINFQLISQYEEAAKNLQANLKTYLEALLSQEIISSENIKNMQSRYFSVESFSEEYNKIRMLKKLENSLQDKDKTVGKNKI